MRVLVLAPHPFYQERGTPIAVDLLVRALSELEHSVDILTFGIGEDRKYKNVKYFRVSSFGIKKMDPGFSFKKLVCDIFMFLKLCKILVKSKYDVIHAVEESAFMAMIVKPFSKTSYIYDIDSCMTTQLVDRFTYLKIFEPVLKWIESLPVRFAAAVVPVCDALADDVKKYNPKKLLVLKDISLLGVIKSNNKAEDINILGFKFMYIGNLESYQGIDLLIESFSKAVKSYDELQLVIIGGSQASIEHYRSIVESLGLSKNVHFLGPKPVAMLDTYMQQADVLVSPRTKGVNTPMKIYSYLHSNIPVLATNLPTHTQVMNHDTAKLAEPNPEAFSKAMIDLVRDAKLRESLSKNAYSFIEREHSYSAYVKKIANLYHEIE